MSPWLRLTARSLVVAASLSACQHADDPRPLDLSFEADSFHAVLWYHDYGGWLRSAETATMTLKELPQPVMMQRAGRISWRATLTKAQTDTLLAAHPATNAWQGAITATIGAASQPNSTRQVPVAFSLPPPSASEGVAAARLHGAGVNR